MDGRPFWLAGLWSAAPDPATGGAGDSYAMVIGEANGAMRVHDRMPVILPNAAAREWVEPGPLPAGLLVHYPAEGMAAWRVGDDAKSSRIEPHPGMAEPVATGCRPPEGARASRMARFAEADDLAAVEDVVAATAAEPVDGEKGRVRHRRDLELSPPDAERVGYAGDYGAGARARAEYLGLAEDRWLVRNH